MNATVHSKMNLIELMDDFGSDDRCRAALEQLRWQDGPICPRCQSKATKIHERFQYDCDSCHYQFSVTAGTIFHDSHMSLWKWFVAVYLITESKKGISANQLSRTLKVSYKTAWYLCHRIRKAVEEINPPKLSGTVEVDETYIGGKQRYIGSGRLNNKTMVLGAVERGGDVRLRVEPQKAATRKVLHSFIRETTHPATERIITDEHRSYRGIADEDTKHETVNHRKEEWVRGDVHTNSVESVWSLFKRSIVGSYHQVSTKHLDGYLNEFEWRFNNRKNPYLFRDTLIKLLSSKNIEYKELTAS